MRRPPGKFGICTGLPSGKRLTPVPRRPSHGPAYPAPVGCAFASRRQIPVEIGDDVRPEREGIGNKDLPGAGEKAGAVGFFKRRRFIGCSSLAYAGWFVRSCLFGHNFTAAGFMDRRKFFKEHLLPAAKRADSSCRDRQFWVS